MRKSILIASLIVVSGQFLSGYCAVAASDAPPGEAKEEIRTNDTKPIDKPSEPVKVEAAKPEAAKPEITKPEAAKPETAKPAKKRVVRNRESDEHKARRIAAKYGVTW